MAMTMRDRAEDERDPGRDVEVPPPPSEALRLDDRRGRVGVGGPFQSTTEPSE